MGLLLAASGIAVEGLDFHQRQVQLVHQQGGLPGVLAAFAAHFGGRQFAQLGVEEFHQPVSRVAIALAELRHQNRNRVGAGRHR